MKYCFFIYVSLLLAACATDGQTSAQKESERLSTIYEDAVQRTVTCSAAVTQMHNYPSLEKSIWFGNTLETPTDYLANKGQLGEGQKEQLALRHDATKACMTMFFAALAPVVQGLHDVHIAYIRLTDQAVVALINDEISVGQYNHANTIILSEMDKAYLATVAEVKTRLDTRHENELANREVQRQAAYRRFQTGLLNAARILSAPSYQSSTSYQAQAKGFLVGEEVSGFNKLCYYNSLGSGAVLTVKATDICPLAK